MKPEEQLMDALLKEQARGRDADESLLAEIEAAIDAAAGRKPAPAWRRVMPLSVAAALVMCAAGLYQLKRDDGAELVMDSPRESTAESAGVVMNEAGRREVMKDAAELIPGGQAPALAKKPAPESESQEIPRPDLGLDPSALLAARDMEETDAAAIYGGVPPAAALSTGNLGGSEVVVPLPARVEIDFKPTVVDGEFARLNPDYKQRVGAFQERTHLPEATEHLIEVCTLDARLHPYVMEILRAFIYERADAFMKEGGLSSEALEPIVRRMEERLLALMDEDQRERFPAWRQAEGGKNPLRFLMEAEPAE